MAQLNDTLVNGDLRVNGKIYGIITSADSATNASNLGSTAASDFALKNGNYSSNGLVAKSASTAATANAVKWTEGSENRTYSVGFSVDNKFYYSKQFNYNAGTQTLCAKNISSVNITGTVSGNLSGSAASALTSKSALSAGSAAKAAELTNKAIKVNSAGTADYATSAGAAPFISHNHNYQLSGNGTALYISAGVNLKPNGNIAISTAANTINISAKDTTYTSLNGINSTEYNALTSTSANNRNPNAHQLSSHTNFSTYFNVTSANSALTSKSALSAGSAQKSYSSYWSKADDNTDLDRVIGCGLAGGSASWTAGSEFYGTVTYDTAFTFNSKSNTMKVINVSATSVTGVTTSGTTIKGVTISGTNITAATTVRGTNLSGTNISGASKTASIDNLINSAARTIPTVNNKTITITTGASPATASFTTNTAADKTITLGSMALKASGDYIPNSYSSSTASTFSGKANSAVNAARLYVTEHSTNNTTYYPVWANGVGNAVRDILTTTAKLQFNPASGQLYISNIVKVGGCSMTWNASTSALDFNF